MRVKGSLPGLVRKGVERDVGRYCEERVPAHLRDKIRIEYELRAIPSRSASDRAVALRGWKVGALLERPQQ
jgi:hypothetical protein